MSYRHFSTPAGLAARARRERAGWRAAVVFGAFFLTASPAPAGLYDLLFHHDVQVITSTDIAPAGALLRPASPSEPVYYLALIKGYHDFGATMGGEKIPAKEQMVGDIARVLAKEGYLPTNALHKPTQVIMFAWGTLNPDVKPNAGDLDLPDAQLNYRQVMRFLGGDKLGLVNASPADWTESTLPGLTRFDPDADALAHLAGDEFYVVALASYEFPVVQPKHPRLLWQTKISCPAIGLVLADTAPTMLAIAAPHIGRPTARPVWVNASDKFKPQVRIGKLKFEEYLDSSPPPAKQEKAPSAPTASDGK